MTGTGTSRSARDAADEEGPTAGLVLGTFTVLLSAGVLLHEIQLGAVPWGLHLPVLVAAVVGLTRPGIPALVGLFAMLAVELVVDLPGPWNHALVMGVLGGGIALWWLATPGAAWRRDPAAFLARIGPVVRVVVVLVWALAFFAKLNHGFLDTTASCAVWILEQVPFVTVPHTLSGAVVLATLAAEGLIPVLLLAGRTRLLGVAGALAFHLVAALGGHTAFSAIALPLYLFFLPPPLVAASVRWVLERLPRSDALAATWRRPWAVVLILLLVVGGTTVLGQGPPAWVVRGRRYVPLTLYLPLAAVYAAALVAGVRRLGTAGTEVGPLRPHGMVPVMIVLVLLVNAASPYVGLKTGWSLTMYSNLRTEPAEFNHLVVPEGVRIFDWQEDLITVYDADPTVAGRLGLGSPPAPHRVPRLRVLQVAADHPDAPVRVAPATSERVPLGSVAKGEVTLLHARLGHLRAVPLRPRCQV